MIVRVQRPKRRRARKQREFARRAAELAFRELAALKVEVARGVASGDHAP